MIEAEQSFVFEKEEAEKRKEKRKRLFLLVLAVTFPAIEAFLMIRYQFNLGNGREIHGVFVMWILIIDQTLIYVSQIVSGY
jgi:hypothetical protein